MIFQGTRQVKRCKLSFIGLQRRIINTKVVDLGKLFRLSNLKYFKQDVNYPLRNVLTLK